MTVGAVACYVAGSEIEVARCYIWPTGEDESGCVVRWNILNEFWTCEILALGFERERGRNVLVKVVLLLGFVQNVYRTGFGNGDV